jgi:hypothetical protein
MVQRLHLYLDLHDLHQELLEVQQGQERRHVLPLHLYLHLHDLHQELLEVQQGLEHEYVLHGL